MRIKLFSILLLMLFINGISISAEVISPNNEKILSTLCLATTFYVDDDYNESTPGWNIDHFNNIQGAINKSSDGDTIYVYNGTYFERLIINKSISLLGQDKTNTIIDGSSNGRVVSLIKSRVDVEGFTIRNSGHYIEDAGIYIESYTNDIVNNIITENQNGVYVIDSKSNYIYGNTITSCNYGIYLLKSESNTLSQNTIKEQKYGVYFQESISNDINGNLIEKNERGLVLKQYCNDNTIAGNTFRKSSEHGVIIESFCYENILHHNNFLDNKPHASFVMSFLNKWEYNYWDNWIGLIVEEYRQFPKGIFGRIFGPIPWINFDWFPLYEPHATSPG